MNKASDEQRDELLHELRANLCDDVLNYEDRSVGIFQCCDLEDWVNDSTNEDGSFEYEGIELLSVKKNEVIFKCEGRFFRIHEVPDKERGTLWDISSLDESEVTKFL